MIRTTARWLFLAILVYAPWAYGSTRLWSIQLLDGLLLACFGLLVLGGLCERRLPLFPLLPVLCLAGLLAETAWMYFNARSYYDAFFWEFVPRPPPFPDLPGSWNRAATFFYLQRQLAMAAAFLIAFDTVSRQEWKQRVFLVMALTGVSVVLLGLAQQAFGAPSIFWLKEDTGLNFFGPFRYHANAGAYLNLVWPVVLFFLVQAFRSSHAHFARTAWISAFFLTFVACAVNISRGAAAITFLLVFVAGIWLFLLLKKTGFPFSFWKCVVIGMVGLLFIAAVFLGGIAARAEGRWAEIGLALTDDNQRALADEACLRTIPDAGWFGYGAGTFSNVFPLHLQFLDGRLIGFWKYAHNDYLQTVIEYGYLGAALWTLFLFSGWLRSTGRAVNPHLRTKDRIRYGMTWLALSGIVLHSLVDFPLQIASIQLYVMVFLAFGWTRPVADEATSAGAGRGFSRTYQVRA